MRLIAAFAALALVSGAVASAPVEAQTISADEVASISGTRWTGSMIWNDGSRYDGTFHFRADGVLVYGYDGQTWDNGRWTQNERLVTFHTNTYYALYSGLTDGQRVRGTSYNRAGSEGTFDIRRSSARR